jgi:hypothetical protein
MTKPVQKTSYVPRVEHKFTHVLLFFALLPVIAVAGMSFITIGIFKAVVIEPWKRGDRVWAVVGLLLYVLPYAAFTLLMVGDGIDWTVRLFHRLWFAGGMLK